MERYPSGTHEAAINSRREIYRYNKHGLKKKKKRKESSPILIYSVRVQRTYGREICKGMHLDLESARYEMGRARGGGRGRWEIWRDAEKG